VYCKGARLRNALPAILALAALAACHRQPARPALERIAILRFENLGADPSDDWMGRAFSEIIASELNGAPGLYAIPSGRWHAIEAGLGARPAAAPGISAERTAALAAGATRIAYGEYAVRGGELAARLTVEDALTGKMTALTPVSAPAADVVPAASALARQISPRTAPYGARNPQVIKAHVNALEDLAGAGVKENLEKAIAAEPDFGPTYRQLAQVRVQEKDPGGALAVLDQALARGKAFPDDERARIQLQAGQLRGDPAARLQALAALANADSYDPQAWHDLAAASVAAHQYSQAADAYRKTLGILPEDADSWNQLGYAAAYAGDLAGATSALDRYAKLAPGSPNPLDSLGDAYVIAGRLPEAEQAYLRAAKMNPAFLAGVDFLKAAMAHLMTGDVAGADGVARQYFDARAAARDPLLDYRKAQWEWTAGRRKAACRQMEQVARAAETAGTREVAARAWTELAMWTLMLGNREGAAEAAKNAAASATPSSAAGAVLVRFLSQAPASPAGWEERAGQLAPNPGQAAIRSMALAYALLVSREYAAAIPVLQEMYQTGNPAADEGLPVLLGWAEMETGRVPETAALLRSNVPLSAAGLTWSMPFHFPRIYYLRAVVAEKQGKAAEARENWRIFRALSGPDPLMWGEEQQAR
jgi:tetratricopeptide (TPR) repeat protein